MPEKSYEIASRKLLESTGTYRAWFSETVSETLANGQVVSKAISNASAVVSNVTVSDLQMLSLANGNYLVSYQSINNSNITYGVSNSLRIESEAGALVGTVSLGQVDKTFSETQLTFTQLVNNNIVIAFKEAPTPISNTTGENGSLRSGLVVQAFNENGVAIGTSNEAVAPIAGFSDSNPHLVALSGGGYLLTWERTQAGVSGNADVFGLAFSATGGRVGSEFLLGVSSAGNQTGLISVTLADGRTLVVWNSDGSMLGQLIDSMGKKSSSVISFGTGSVVDIEAHPDGGLVILFNDNGFKGQAFDASFKPLGEVFIAPNGDLAIGGDGTLVISSPSGRDFVEFFLVASGFRENIGTDQAENLFASSVGSRVVGLGGSDWLVGGASEDILIGGAGNDHLQGGAGNDLLDGGPGANRLEGGPGVDTADYSKSINAVKASLASGSAAHEDATDGLLEIENLIGSAFDDILTGDDGPNRLEGEGGNDVLQGGRGSDQLIGGDGVDTVSYVGDFGGVFVNLTLGQGFTNFAFGDTYASIENAIGSSWADFLIGDPGVNRLDGGPGDDTIIGAVGADVLIGGDGTDLLSFEDNSGTIFVNLLTGNGYNNAAQGDVFSGFENAIGGLFDDTLIGDHSANKLEGAMGADTLVGNGGADIFVFSHAPSAPRQYDAPSANANVDTIFDFVSGEDKIEVKAAAFGGGLAAGSLDAGAFVLGSAASEADDRFIYDQGAGRLYFDADGSGAGAKVLMAILPNHDAITAADFVIV